ncbi:4Fe-4S binding protein [uncultured Treponema sp.]|uniref:4Fe-4S binding protein n=1 Tax=uncultured Treponema sp. TaxID=162155 RepID=UPI0025F87572|nr:4Fe-4S binding protein [uncultured Treponema sp.]
MILAYFFLFLMLLIIVALIFYLFCFFLPALKLKYEGITDSLATEMHFPDNTSEELIKTDCSNVAVINDAETEGDKKINRRLFYKGEKNCRLFHETYGSEYTNPNICIGFGDCVKICPQEAIFIRNKKAVVSNLCNGCGKCLDYCPKKIISLVPRTKKTDETSKKYFKFWSACYKLLKVVRGE